MTDASANSKNSGDGMRSELSARRWALVSFEKCEVSDVTYAEAADRMAELEREHIPGLCIVTAEAAARMTG